MGAGSAAWLVKGSAQHPTLQTVILSKGREIVNVCGESCLASACSSMVVRVSC